MVFPPLAAPPPCRVGGPVGCVGGSLLCSPLMTSSSPFFRRSSAVRTKAAAEAPPRAPLLMLSSPQDPGSRFLFDLRKNGEEEGEKRLKLNRVVALPQMAGHHVIGCSQGFLITVDTSISKKTKIHATNPLTGASLPLPSTPALSHLRSSKDFNRKYVFRDTWTTPPPHPVLLDTHFQLLCRGKAILSPRLSTIFVAMPRLPPLIARLGVDTSWTSSEPHPCLVSAVMDDDEDIYRGPLPPSDCIFHKGNLHFLWGESLFAIDADDPSYPPPKMIYPSLPFSNLEISRFSLAESPSGDDLFLVCRIYSEGHRALTDGFKVYKLQLQRDEVGNALRHVWKEMESIGNLAMFVSHGATVAISIDAGDGCSNFRPNCIYFANDYYLRSYGIQMLEPVRRSDTGVYNLGDGSIELYELTDSSVQDFTWPLPLWYMPSTPL